MPSSCSTRPKISTAKATSSGPCIFGFTTYIEPAREFARRPFGPMSCSAISAVIAASMMPSGTSLPSRSRIAGLVIRWPTLLTSISERHFSVEGRAVRRLVIEVGVELAREGLAALVDLFLEVALHQAEPVAVDGDLVLGVDRGDRILAVLDRGDRRIRARRRRCRPGRPCRSPSWRRSAPRYDAVVAAAGTGSGVRPSPR